jgi:hypothetical protein
MIVERKLTPLPSYATRPDRANEHRNFVLEGCK